MSTTITRNQVDYDGDGIVSDWERRLAQVDYNQLRGQSTSSSRSTVNRTRLATLMARLSPDARYIDAGSVRSPLENRQYEVILAEKRAEAVRSALINRNQNVLAQQTAGLKLKAATLGNQAGSTGSEPAIATKTYSMTYGGRDQHSSSSSQTSTSSRAQTYQAAGETYKASTFSAPANWGAVVVEPTFDSSAYLQSMQVEDNIMSSWDQVNQNTSRGKQLMLLFFYFARMAESGDMGAMYQFMKFITYIISKDKAKQQIEMGKKLIELQDLSRQWTDKLMQLQTSASDPNSSNELMKMMTIVKSKTDEIASSQKLISQMMEEFAQIVETLTNTTKAALEAHGRIMRSVSVMR